MTGEGAAEARRERLWQTLRAMGFDPPAACTGAYSGVVLDSRVFERGVYHMKAAELILHFLFAHLDPGRFKREFFDSWPIGDPRQARDFRAHSFRWLDELRRQSMEREDGEWPVDVPVRRSFVDECKGPRFEEVLWTLTVLVTHRLLRRNGGWDKHLKHPLRTVMRQRAMGGELAQALSSCRARYARRTRDRLRAQAVWKQTEASLGQKVDGLRGEAQQAFEEFRICRKRMGAEVADPDSVPDVDASAEEVGQALARLVDEAAGLWRGSAGWIEENEQLIDTVDAVVDQRANSVRLEGKRHVRLAPSSQMADQWARWLAARKATPFHGSSVNLQVLARMAASCVGALRRGITASGEDQGPVALDLDHDISDRPPSLPDASERVAMLDQELEQQEARIARLQRMRARLLEQRSAVGDIIAGQRGDSAEAATARLAGIVRGAVASSRPASSQLPSSRPPMAATERVHQLAGAWDDLVVVEDYPQHTLDSAALRGGAGVDPLGTPYSLGFSFLSDHSTPARSTLVGSVRASRLAKRPRCGDGDEQLRTAKRREVGVRRMDVDGPGDDTFLGSEVPDFLVD
ncbi:hypothetical protein GGF46_001995 [Coemansia sp. RSA 552]|nr:hypothetical protein GGF46_001995 [Coemansia sp. RSA 552]